MATTLTIEQTAEALGMTLKKAEEEFNLGYLMGYIIPGSEKKNIPLVYVETYRIKYGLPSTEKLKGLIDRFGLD